MTTAEDVLRQLGQPTTDYGRAVDEITRVRQEHSRMLEALVNIATFGRGPAKQTARNVLKTVGGDR